MSDSTSVASDDDKVSANLAPKDVQRLEVLLSRAASIFYQAWLGFREQTCEPHMSNITRIEKHGSSITCHFGSTPEPKEQWFCKFPEQSPASKEQNEMLLNYCQCNSPYAYLYPLAERLFRGLSSNLDPFVTVLSEYSQV